MVDKWTNPTNASLRGEDSRPLQQTFSSLAVYLDKLDTAITAAAGAGVLSLTGTANQITVSAGTGNVTLSLPQNIHTGASPTFVGMTLSGALINSSTITAMNGGVDGGLVMRTWTASGSFVSLATRDMAGSEYCLISDGTNTFVGAGTSGITYIRGAANDTTGQVAVRASNVDISGTLNRGYSSASAGNSSYTQYGPNATWGAYLRVGATPSVVASGIAQVISTDGNLHLDSGTTNSMYLNYYSGRTISVHGFMSMNGQAIGNAGYIQSGATGVTDAGSVSATNWFRSTGGSGWYNQSYGGGLYMSDTTWLRTYNGKNFYCDGSDVRSNGVFSCNNTNNGANLRMLSGNIASYGWYGYYAFYVDGTHSKTFVINHPTKQDNYLVHACAEGPTSDVFYRGEAQLGNGICVVKLPDYFEALTEQHGRTIMITPIADENGFAANLAAHEIHDGQFVVEQIGGFHVPNQRFWWRVDAVRKGTEFEVEPAKDVTEVAGMGPYTYIKKKVA